MTYAVVDKHSNRAIAIIDDTLKSYFESKLPAFDILEIVSVGTSRISCQDFYCTSISINVKYNMYDRRTYYMIRDFNGDLTIEQVYEKLNS